MASLYLLICESLILTSDEILELCRFFAAAINDRSYQSSSSISFPLTSPSRINVSSPPSRILLVLRIQALFFRIIVNASSAIDDASHHRIHIFKASPVPVSLVRVVETNSRGSRKEKV